MKSFFITILDAIDPKRRGPWFASYGWKGALFISVLTVIFYLLMRPVGCGTAFGMFINFFTLGVHEIGHPIFRFLSGGNQFLTITGGTFMELFVPTFAFLYFLRRGWEIQADVCLLLLAIAFKSIGFYAGAMEFEPAVLMINADADSVGDWDYMHKWFGTENHIWAVRHTFYLLSAFTAALGLWLIGLHSKLWLKRPPIEEEMREHLDENSFKHSDFPETADMLDIDISTPQSKEKK